MIEITAITIISNNILLTLLNINNNMLNCKIYWNMLNFIKSAKYNKPKYITLFQINFIDSLHRYKSSFLLYFSIRVRERIRFQYVLYLIWYPWNIRKSHLNSNLKPSISSNSKVIDDLTKGLLSLFIIYNL